MARLTWIFIVVLLSCGAAKKTSTSVNSAQENFVNTFKDSIPACIRAKIDSFKVAPQHEQPQRVTQYEYRGKKVYYVTMHCCDFFNELYDEQCKLLGHPDGGFTGKGDGKLPDFNKEKTKEKIIWQVKQ
jgi:hypothetical protein